MGTGKGWGKECGRGGEEGREGEMGIGDGECIGERERGRRSWAPVETF